MKKGWTKEIIPDEELDFSNAVKGKKTPKAGWFDEKGVHNWLMAREEKRKAKQLKENERKAKK